MQKKAEQIGDDLGDRSHARLRQRRQVYPSFSLLASLLTIQLRGRSWQVWLSQFGPLGKSCAFLVDDYVAGGTAITIARRSFPEY
jgi:hypothetical protein